MADLFGKLKHGIDKGVATVSVKSSTALEINKVRVQIHGLTEKIEQGKKELGHRLYAMYLEKNFKEDVYRNLCEGIQSLEAERKLQEERIESLKSEEGKILGKNSESQVCQCGAALEEDMVFCVECGAKVK